MMERKRLALFSGLGLLLACATAPTGTSASAAWEIQSELGRWEGKAPARFNDGGILEARWPLAAGASCAGTEVSVTAEGPWKDALRAGPAYEISAGLCGVLVASSRRDEAREADLTTGKAELRIGALPPVALEIVARAYESEKIEGMPPKYLEPPKKFLPRIRRESAEIGRLYRASVKTSRLWEGRFRNPVAGSLGPEARVDCRTLPSETPGCIKSRFGKTRTYNGLPRSPHPGTDLKAPMGQPLVAPARGRVVLAKNLYFTGNTVILDHGAGLVTIYAHLSKLKVKSGVTIPAGTPLGASGDTGRAVGAHLHWGAVLGGTKIEPLELMGMLK